MIIDHRQHGAEKVPGAEGKEALQPLSGKPEGNFQTGGEEQYQRVNQTVGHFLCHQRPGAKATQGHKNAHEGGNHRADDGGKEEFPELQMAGGVSGQDGLEGVDKEGQRHDPDHGDQGRLAVKTGDQRRAQEHARVHDRRHGKGRPQHGGIVQLVRVLFLDQGGIESAGNKHVAQHKENGNDAHKAVILRHQDPGKNHGDHQRHKPCADPLRHRPHHPAKGAFLQMFIVLGFHRLSFQWGRCCLMAFRSKRKHMASRA